MVGGERPGEHAALAAAGWCLSCDKDISRPEADLPAKKPLPVSRKGPSYEPMNRMISPAAQNEIVTWV